MSACNCSSTNLFGIPPKEVFDLDTKAIEYHVLGLLKAIGEDPEREGLRETPARVARPFHLLTIALNALVLVGALVLVIALRAWYLPMFGDLAPHSSPFTTHPSPLTLLIALAIFLLVSALNYMAITGKVRTIWHIHE